MYRTHDSLTARKPERQWLRAMTTMSDHFAGPAPGSDPSQSQLLLAGEKH
jgi:hypothetical protein